MRYKAKSGFTIVELLVVIVVIGILAAITVVSYSGISNRALSVKLRSELEGIAKILKMDSVQSDTESYPSSLSSANNGVGIPTSEGTTLRYYYNNSISPATFCVEAINNNTYYKVGNDSPPTEGDCLDYGLISYWNLDENTGTSVADSGSSSHSGIAQSAAWVSGVKNSALSFNGSSNVSLGDYSYNFSKSEVTISAWVYPTSTSSRRTILSLGNNSLLNIQLELGFDCLSTTSDHCIALNISGSGKARTIDGAYSNDEWSHVVYTKDSSSQHIYVNAIEKALNIDSTYSLSDNSAEKFIGQRAPGSQVFIGSIDEVRLYDRALTQEEVTSLYNQMAP
ncbi:LamG domain-containing protein [Candidatus Saccharibacteria bacterium]|nr:LamG domain-containing protein [Candidatus Saccharibacteria bacterium]